MSRGTTSRGRGMTLLEVMIVVAIGGILAALAGPNLIGLVRRTRARGQAATLVATINTARAQAITRGFSQVVCLDNTVTPAAIMSYQKQNAIAPTAIDATTAQLVLPGDRVYDRQWLDGSVSLTLPWATTLVQLVFDTDGKVHEFYGGATCAALPATTVTPPMVNQTFRASSSDLAVFEEFIVSADGPAKHKP